MYNAGPMVDTHIGQEGGGDRVYGSGLTKHPPHGSCAETQGVVAHNSPLRGEERSSTQW